MGGLDRAARNRSRLRFARMSDHIRSILDTIREPFLVLDGGLRIRLVNQSFCRTFQLSSQEIIGKSVDMLGDGAWKSLALRNWLETSLAKRSDIPDFEVEGPFPALGT